MVLSSPNAGLGAPMPPAQKSAKNTINTAPKLPASSPPNSSAATSGEDSFTKSAPKSAPHFAGDPNKGKSKDREYAEYMAAQAGSNPDDIWKKLCSSTADDAGYETQDEQWSEKYPGHFKRGGQYYKGADSQTLSAYQTRGQATTKLEQEIADYEEERDSSSKARNDAIWKQLWAQPADEPVASREASPEAGSSHRLSEKEKAALERSLSKRNKDEETDPRRSVSPLSNAGYETQDEQWSKKYPGYFKRGGRYHDKHGNPV